MRVDEHGEILTLVLGTILIAVGAAHWLGVSSLIATMALGATLINLAGEGRHLFDVLGDRPPIYAIFFVLAGAHLQLSSLLLIGLTGVGYTLARIAGKIAGAWYGARRAGYRTWSRSMASRWLHTPVSRLALFCRSVPYFPNMPSFDGDPGLSVDQ